MMLGTIGTMFSKKFIASNRRGEGAAIRACAAAIGKTSSLIVPIAPGIDVEVDARGSALSAQNCVV